MVPTAAPLAFESRLSTDQAPRRRAASAPPPANVEEAPLVNCRIVVPYFVTKPGQQLFVSGSGAALGEWEPARAVPLVWQEGHAHQAVVRLPPNKVVQAKLVLLENGRPAIIEEGNPRDIMLMPVNGKAATDSADEGSGALAEAASAVAALRGGGAAHGAQRMDYQILCHFGSTEATQILRLPIVLPAKEQGDRRVLCKFVVLLDSVKLEARQYPVVVGSSEELGAWKAEGGVKLMRQAGGYWTRRVELPLSQGDIQAKVVICNADGQPAFWEPGTTNRVLSAPASPAGASASAMHIFVCRWSAPGHTPVVSVPVEHEDASSQYVQQLDAAQKEIGLMRQAVTAKSRTVQSLESELTASRKSERALREEVSVLRGELGNMMQELEKSQRAELTARKQAATMNEELARLGETYERQISFLEQKLDEMEAEIKSLQKRLTSGGGSSDGGSGQGKAYGSASGNGAGPSNGRSPPSNNSSSSGSSNKNDKSISRSSWR